MAGNYSIAKGKVLPMGNGWCEGEALTFIRQLNGREIINETYRLVIKGKNVTSLNVTMHNFAKVGKMQINNLQINKEKLIKNKIRIKYEDIHKKLVYKVEGNKVLPLWYLEHDNIVILFDAIKGIHYEFK